MIVVLHGFGSTGEASSTCKLIRDAFPNQLVITPTYDAHDPEKAVRQIRRAVQDNLSLADEDLVFVGVSLGGFWARYFANAYEGAKLVLLNPSLDPATNLQCRIGVCTNYATNEAFEVTKKMVDDFRRYEIGADLSTLPVYLIVAADDDIVPPTTAIDKYTGRAMIKIVQDGGHRLQSHADLIVSTVATALNTYQ